MALGWLPGGTADKGHMLKLKTFKIILFRSRVRLIHLTLILAAGGKYQEAKLSGTIQVPSRSRERCRTCGLVLEKSGQETKSRV